LLFIYNLHRLTITQRFRPFDNNHSVRLKSGKNFYVRAVIGTQRNRPAFEGIALHHEKRISKNWS